MLNGSGFGWGFILVLMLYVTGPVVGIGGVVALAILKAWFAFSWAWLAAPGGIFIAWLVWVLYMKAKY